MGFPTIRIVLFPLCLLTSSLSFGAIRDGVFSLLQIIGIDLRPAARSRFSTAWGNSTEEDHAQRSDTLDYFRGLRDEIRDLLTVVPIESVAGRFCREDDAVCAVCLCEYENEDLVLLLPMCDHIFHRRCLDRWLDQNQTTCPTCRASLMTEELARKNKRREERLMADLALCFSFCHGSNFVRSSWYHRRHSFDHWIQ